MSSNDNGKGLKEMAAEEIKVLGGKIYDDAAKPAVVQVGKTLELVVEVGLAIPNMILGGAKAGLDKLSAAIKRKLGPVPEDRLLPPPATIAAPAALQYMLLGDGDEASELREMFENLLVASMDRDTADSAHPAFVSMISQLTPDEAWILKSIDRMKYDSSAHGSHSEFNTTLGTDIIIDESRLRTCISNLGRLGIIRFDSGVRGGFDDTGPGFIEVTPLGAQFLQACANNAKLPKLPRL